MPCPKVLIQARPRSRILIQGPSPRFRFQGRIGEVCVGGDQTPTEPPSFGLGAKVSHEEEVEEFDVEDEEDEEGDEEIRQRANGYVLMGTRILGIQAKNGSEWLGEWLRRLFALSRSRWFPTDRTFGRFEPGSECHLFSKI